jgi:predicted transposase YbfD/YdcC
LLKPLLRDIEGEGDYVMYAKENQARLLEDVRLMFEDPTECGDTKTTAQATDMGHGRIESRRMTTSDGLVGYSDWPGLQQVFKLERHVAFKKSGKETTEVVYGVTSLSQDKADASRLLNLTRSHWTIENKSHWVRDVTYDEDRSQVRCGSIPQVMATMRNLAITLMRLAGESNIASACRKFAAKPYPALALMGISLEK